MKVEGLDKRAVVVDTYDPLSQDSEGRAAQQRHTAKRPGQLSCPRRT